MAEIVISDDYDLDKNKAEPTSVISLIHSMQDVYISKRANAIDLESKYLGVTHPQVNGVNPNRAWWGDTITISGLNFSNILKENVVHFYPEAVKANLVPEENKVVVNIAEGTRSGYPIVSVQGISGYTTGLSGAFLEVVAKGITFPYIRSIVEDRENHYIYVGYDDSGNPKIAKVDLYKVNPTWQIVDGAPDSRIRPYLARMVTSGANAGEICYIRDEMEGGTYKPDVYCISEAEGPHRVAHLHDVGFNSTLDYIVAFDATPDGQHFFVADYETKHIIHVQRGNDPNIASINSDWGHRAPYIFDFFISKRRTGLAAYYDAYGGLAVLLATKGTNTEPNTICPAGGNGTCLWRVFENSSIQYSFLTDMQIYDIEVDRLVSLTEPTPSTTFFYLMDGGIATLATDVNHDIRGFVDAINTPPSPIFDSLMLNVNPWYFIPYVSERPDNNQNEIIISETPDIKQYEHPRQTKPRYVKIRFKGWAFRYYYLRVLDGRDLAGYAPEEPDPNPSAGDLCWSWNKHQPPGPFLNVCDNKSWSGDNPQDFGLCVSDENCLSPQRILIAYMGPGNGQTAEWEGYLKLPSRYSGDNLIIQLSEIPYGYSENPPRNPQCYQVDDINCKQPVDAYSGVYIGWKRVFL